MAEMNNTIEQYNEVIEQCRNLFINKMKDYGCAWRILRLPSLTDQIFIKAQRIRGLQENAVHKIDEGEEPEFIGIINYFGIFFIASLITGIIESIFKLGIGTYAFLPTYYFAYSSHDAFDIRLLYPIPLTIVLILWLNSIIKKKEIN